jgi:hypothetical protein
MLKLFRYLFVILFVSTGLVLAQSAAIKKDVSKQIVDPKTEVSVPVTEGAGQTVFQVRSPEVGDTIGTSSYDYFTNSVMRKQVVYYEGIHLAPMLRGHLPTAARRVVTYIYNDGTNYVQVPAFDTSSNSGWGHIDVSLTGDLAGTIGIAAHSPNRLAIWDPGSSTFVTSQFEPNTDPSVQWLGENIFLATSGNRLLFDFWKTTDLGQSFTSMGTITDFPNIFWGENGGVEVGIAKSPNEQNMIYFGTNTYIGGGHVYDGFARDSADNVWIIKTTDAGATFDGYSIGWDGDPTLLPEYTVTEFIDTVTYSVGGTSYSVVLNQNVEITYTPLFENFGHLDMSITDDGVVHAIANGYGLAVANVAVTRPGTTIQDTVLLSAENALFPVIYWNSTTNKWKAISDPNIDQIADTIMADKRPGNGIGQSYPSLSISENGQVLYAIWTGPELVGTDVILDEVTGLMLTDLYHAYSIDGGATWTYGGSTLANKSRMGEIYGHAAQHLQLENTDANVYTAHIIYLEDTESGASVFGGANGAATTNPVVYKTFSFEVTGVEDNANVVNSFQLNQNYPNPFNPVTTIKYTVPTAGNVVLKVYDVLGREVSTLINRVQEAGQHSISFDASALSSGMYIYTITSGNFTASKKMMLMK